MSGATLNTGSTAQPEAIERPARRAALCGWRDLSRDWRRWSIIERITALVLLVGIAATSVAALAGALA